MMYATVLIVVALLFLVMGLMVYSGRLTLRKVRNQSAYNRSMGFAVGAMGLVCLTSGVMDFDGRIGRLVATIVLIAGLALCLFALWRVNNRHDGI